MTNAKHKKPDIIQSFDYYLDREYYKAGIGMFSSDRLIRTDRLEDWNEWQIQCEKMPDKIFINGEEYTLTPLSTKSNV